MKNSSAKKTAANNQFLANVKRVCNKLIYKKVLGLVNSPEGEAGALKYLSTIFTSTDVFVK